MKQHEPGSLELTPLADGKTHEKLTAEKSRADRASQSHAEAAKENRKLQRRLADISAERDEALDSLVESRRLLQEAEEELGALKGRVSQLVEVAERGLILEREYRNGANKQQLAVLIGSIRASAKRALKND